MQPCRNLRILPYTGILLLLLLLSSCGEAAPGAVNGALDARSWDPVEQGMLELQGEWEMYWMEYIDPSKAKRDQASQGAPVIAHQPALWNNLDHPEAPLPAEGFASFRLRVQLGESWPEVLGVRVLEMSTAFTLYINGSLVSRAGVPGTDRESTKPTLIPQTNSYYRGGAEELDIVLHVANFLDREGGRRRPILIGTTENAMLLRHRTMAIEGLIAGALLLISLYHLILYLSHRDNALPLSFALICTVFAARGMLEGERILLGLMQFPFLLYARIWFTSYYLIPPAVLYFLHNLFPEEAKPLVFKGFIAAATAFSAVTFFSDMPFITHMLGWYHPFTLAALLYGSWLLIQAMKKERTGSAVFLVSIIFLGVTGINDILYTENIINTMYLAPIGILSFVCFQAYYIASRFSTSLKQVQNLSSELRAHSGKLEEMAAERTQELQQRTQDLEESMSYAHMIQRANLQEESDLQKFFPKSFLLQQSKDIIGGNFYQFSRDGDRDNSLRTVIVGETASGGVPGAMMAMQALSMLRSELPTQKAVAKPLELTKLCDSLNSRLHTESNLLIIQLQDAEVTAVISGCSLFHISGGSAREIIPAPDHTAMFHIEAGETLYLCSSGAMRHAQSLRPDSESSQEAFLQTISELAGDHFGNHRQKLIELLDLRNQELQTDLIIIGLNYTQ